MILPILTCIGIVLVGIACIREYRGIGETIGLSLLGGLLGLCLGVIVLFAGNACADMTAEKIEIRTEAPIYAVEDNFGTSGILGGGVFVIAGQIDSKLYYNVLIDGSYGKCVVSLPTDKTYISYTDYNNEEPHMDTITYKFKSPVLDFLFLEPMEENYVLYVPEGSVTHSLNIDLK